MTNSSQDNFYLNKEADCFFDRWAKNKPKEFNTPELLRDNKKSIYDTLYENINLSNLNVLEIGCFIGDLLFFLKKNHDCEVIGIEPSKKAVLHCLNNFNIKLINSTFSRSVLFRNKSENYKKFDLIILDDVLSWIDRKLILGVISSIDWLIKDEGYIFIRDFVPNKNFAFSNHHHPDDKIFNFKQKNGHKEFFLLAGLYKTIFNNEFYSEKFQQLKTMDKQAILWGDSILRKVKGFTHPIKKPNEII